MPIRCYRDADHSISADLELWRSCSRTFLTDQEAREIANNVIRFLRVLIERTAAKAHGKSSRSL